MRVLLTGSTGIIGTHLSKKFVKKYRNLAMISKSVNKKSHNFFKLDLIDLDAVNTFVDRQEKFDVLIFLVGLAHSKGKTADLKSFKLINFITLKNLITTFEKYNKMPDKIIFSSTISVYGEKLSTKNYYETTIPEPYTPYALTKLQAENYLLEFYSNKTWILRFAPVYSDEFQLNIKRRSMIGNFFYKVGIGEKKLSLCNILNIEFSIKEIIKNKIPKGIYNISDPYEYTYDELLKSKKAKNILKVPALVIWIIYLVAKVARQNQLKENSIKLLSDNIFSSKKFQKYKFLPHSIYKSEYHDSSSFN